MNLFILRILKFTTILLITFLIILLGSSFFIRSTANFKVNNNIVYAVFGHSHPECAFNDTLINNFKNFSESGESYLYTYSKLKYFLQQNSSINTVFIEFTNNQIEEIMNEWIWGDNNLSNLSVYFPFLGFNENKIILMNNCWGLIKNSPLVIKKNISYIVKLDLNFSHKLGGYLYLNRSKTDSLLKYNSTSKLPLSRHKLSEYNILYLEKIINFCNDKNIKVILIRTPVHPKWNGLANEQNFLNIVRTRFSKVEFLDFKNYPLSNAEFADLEHLNYWGAKKFSIWINSLLNRGILKESNKQELINESILNESIRGKQGFN